MDGKVTISTALDNSGFKSGVQNISGSLGGLKGVLTKIGALVTTAFAVKKLVQFSAACVTLGSDVAEVQNVVDTAFGSMSYKMEAFADTAITNFGMSQLAAKKTGSAYMAMAKGMGVADEAASDMAIALTGLTGDVASFYNLSQSDVDAKMRSVFTGETESLKSLGVVMTQTNLDAYALANGFSKTTGAMNQAELVQLRYAYVMDTLKLAQGDFLKTQGSWANQTRILSMQWQQFMSVIGQALTTVLLPAVKVLNSIVAALIKMANSFNSAITAIFGGANKQIQSTADTAAGVTDAISDSVDQQDALTDATKKTAKAQNKLGIDELNVISQSSGSSSGSTAGVSATDTELSQITETAEEIPPFITKIKKSFESLQKAFAPSISAWGKSFTSLKDDFTAAFGDMKVTAQSLWTEALQPLSNNILTDFIPSVVNSISTALAPVFSDVLGTAIHEFALDFQVIANTVSGVINNLIIPAVQLLQDIVVGVFDGIKKAWDEYGNGIISAWKTFKEGIRAIWVSIDENVIQPVLKSIAAVLDNLWNNHLKPLWDNITRFIGAAIEMILAVWNTAIYPFIQNMVDVFGPKIAATINVIVTQFGGLIGAITDVISGIVRILTGLCEFITGVFTGDWKKVWTGIKDIFCGIWDAIKAVLISIVNSIIGVLNQMISGLINGLNSVIDTINSIFSIQIPNNKAFGAYAGQSFGLNLGHLTGYQIPLLAQGAVIPPNREFLAVLGDQSNGTNIEAPLDTIKQALAEVMAQAGSNQNITLSIVTTLDGEVVYRNQQKIKAGKGYPVGMNPAFT